VTRGPDILEISNLEDLPIRYGYFDDESGEYVIASPKTPVKWINYVGSLDFGGLWTIPASR